MKRLYYDCPIQAAYMAKYFGVEFTIPDDWKELVKDKIKLDGSIFLMYFKDQPLQGFRYAAPIFYIHPDKIPIFEPKEGDIVIMGEDSGWLSKYEYTNGTGSYWAIGYPDGSVGGDGEKPLIVFRNSQPFIIPKEKS